MYATDRNYAPICGVSLYSLLTNNKSERIHAYIFKKNLEEYEEKFLTLENEFNVEITFIDISEIEDICKEHQMPTFRGGYMAYARLFANKYVENKKVLYLDCDTLITGSIKELWEMDMQGKPAAAVLDCIHEYANRFIYRPDKSNYINSGVILIDYKIWNENNCTKKIEDSLKLIDINKTATYGDQDILNHAMGDEFYIISPKYNAMYLTRYFDAEKTYIVLSKDRKSYYSRETLVNARDDIRIIHYSGRNYLRPWSINCSLSKKEIEQWDFYLKHSPFYDYKKMISVNEIKSALIRLYLNYNCRLLCYLHGKFKKFSLSNRLNKED